jgi:hypothetical protein
MSPKEEVKIYTSLGTYTFEMLRNQELESSMEVLKNENLRLFKQIKILNDLNIKNTNIIEQQNLDLQKSRGELKNLVTEIEKLKKDLFETSNKKGLFRKMFGL